MLTERSLTIVRLSMGQAAGGRIDPCHEEQEARERLSVRQILPMLVDFSAHRQHASPEAGPPTSSMTNIPALSRRPTAPIWIYSPRRLKMHSEVILKSYFILVSQEALQIMARPCVGPIPINACVTIDDITDVIRKSTAYALHRRRLDVGLNGAMADSRRATTPEIAKGRLQ
jgi:hypothetical protein